MRSLNYPHGFRSIDTHFIQLACFAKIGEKFFFGIRAFFE
ncbi:hypothetical protein T4D_3778 [Trichinella pseudospiralis]|uniref:Uncharacterized protein n=1 Tax=Trichinella pseudospiralis TaxID=6337 RepID=A0A0V1DR33_TRIPS|nr:hypothetical protein T4D_3778 [Trichinella pseudospiralis]